MYGCPVPGKILACRLLASGFPCDVFRAVHCPEDMPGDIVPVTYL